MTTPQLFLTVMYRDADAGFAFLRALGFEEVLVVRNPDDERLVEHSQFRWRDTGGLMAGSVREGASHATDDAVGTASAYLVVETDAEVDAAHERALAAGGTSFAAPVDEPYGGRGCTVRDPEGNTFSIGSYAGEA
ncbi:VOC family protein [Pseudoclavibacter endophyticus]|nr:VOC family protein [Pseudoclavibacter endophyticus]